MVRSPNWRLTSKMFQLKLIELGEENEKRNSYLFLFFIKYDPYLNVFERNFHSIF